MIIAIESAPAESLGVYSMTKMKARCGASSMGKLVSPRENPKLLWSPLMGAAPKLVMKSVSVPSLVPVTLLSYVVPEGTEPKSSGHGDKTSCAPPPAPQAPDDEDPLDAAPVVAPPVPLPVEPPLPPVPALELVPLLPPSPAEPPPTRSRVGV
jgi:hypothetical protein